MYWYRRDLHVFFIIYVTTMALCLVKHINSFSKPVVTATANLVAPAMLPATPAIPAAVAVPLPARMLVMLALLATTT